MLTTRPPEVAVCALMSQMVTIDSDVVTDVYNADVWCCMLLPQMGTFHSQYSTPHYKYFHFPTKSVPGRHCCTIKNDFMPRWISKSLI
jgi:hypothetical protein